MRRILVVGLAAALAITSAGTNVPTAFAQGALAGEVRMTLGDALEIALENNLDLVSARRDPQIAEQNIERNQVPFDPVLGAQAQYSTDSQDETNTVRDPETGAFLGEFPGALDQDTLAGYVSWRQLLDFGATYNVSLGANDLGEVPDLARSVFVVRFLQ